MNKKFALAVLPIIAMLAGCGEAPAASSSAPASETPASSVVISSGGESHAADSSEDKKESVAPASSSSDGTYVPQIKEATTITLWSITGQNNQAALQSYIDEFTALEPNVTVENVIQTGMGYNDLKAAVIKGFTGNTYPDMVQCYADHVAEYLNYNKAVNLDPYINNATYGWTEEDKADIFDTYIDEGYQYSVDGCYSVPYCKSTEAMYYNEDVLIGLDLTSIDNTINNGKPLSKPYIESLTWEELFGKLCPAIVSYNEALPADQKIINNADHEAVLGYDSDDNLFITLAQQYGIGYTSIDPVTGEGVFNFGEGQDRTDMEALLTNWHTYAQNGYIMSKGTIDDYVNNYFVAKGCLFSVGSTGGVKYQFSTSNPMNVGVAPIPHAEGHDLAIINQGPSLTVLDHQDDNRKLASWLLYKTITNKKNSLNWALNSGYSGIRKSNFESDEYLDASETIGKSPKTLDRLTALNMAYTAREDIINSLFVSPAFLGSSTARTQVSAIMTNVLLTTTDIANLDTWFTDAYNACLLAVA